MEFQSEYILLPLGNQELQIRYYGIIIVVAMLIAAWIAARLARQNGQDPDHVWGALTWAIFPGIIFARLWFVIFPGATAVAEGRTTAWYFENFFNTTNGAIAVWSGGLSIFGAVLGGLLGMWLYFGPAHNRVGHAFHIIFLPITIIFEAIGWVIMAIVNRLSRKEVKPFQLPRFEPSFSETGTTMLPWLDIAGVVLPLAQAIGRWANWVNQELYGLPTTLPWGIPIDQQHRVGQYASGVDYPFAGAEQTLFHPLFLYESLWSLVAFFVLLNLYTRNRDKFSTGDFFLIYLAQYSFVRFFLEFLRIEQAYIPGTTINSSQALTAVVFVVALVLFLRNRSTRTATA